MRSPIVPILIVAIVAPRVLADELRGTVVDAQGNSLAGVRIDISTAAPKSGPQLLRPSLYPDCTKWTTSDKDGRFTIGKLNPTLKFRLMATAPGKRTVRTTLLDPAIETAWIVLADLPADTPPHRVLQGRLVSVEGAPIPDALVEPCGANTATRRWSGRVEGAMSAVSDDQGRFRMLLTEDYVAVDIEVAAFGFAGAIVELLAPGNEIHKITVPSGTAVTGRIEFAGKACPGMPIAVAQVNRGHLARPHLGKVLATTKEDGSFHFEALPSEEPYAIFSPAESGWKGPVTATRLFMAKEDGATRELGTLEATSGLSFGGQIRMADGQAVPQGTRLVLSRMPFLGSIQAPVLPDGSFQIENLPPETYEVTIHASGVVLDERRSRYQVLGQRSFAVRLLESRIGVEIPLRPLKESETLIPTVPGRRNAPEPTAGQQTLAGVVVDPSDKPIAGVRISTYLVGGGQLPVYFKVGGRPHRTFATSRRDGRFEITNLPNEPVELMFFVPGAYGYPVGKGGRSILYPGRLRPELNQTHIRIIFDPTLTTPPIDLR